MIQWHVNDTTLDTIKANNGHSMHLPLMDVKEYSPTHNIIHATYLSKLSSIFRNGLNRGKRMHIHFCEHLEDTYHRRRKDTDILLYVDAVRAQEDGIKFYRTQNDLIVSPGDSNGCIP